MPTLKDLAKTNYQFDPFQTSSAVAQDPIGLVTGPLKLIPEVAKGVLRLGANAVQSVSPVQIPGADQMPETFGGRASMLANSATLGILEQLQNAYAETKSIDKTVGKVLYDLSPLEELKRLTSGRDEEGNPLTSEQVGQEIVQGALEVLPIAGGVRALTKVLNRGVQPIQIGRTGILTKAQYGDKPLPTRVGAKAESAQLSFAEPTFKAYENPKYDPLNPQNLLEPEGMPEMLSKRQATAIEQAVDGEVKQTLAKKVLDPATPKARQIAQLAHDLMDEGGLSPQGIASFFESQGLDITLGAQVLVDEMTQFASTMSEASAHMNIARKLAQKMRNSSSIRQTRDFLENAMDRITDPAKKAKLKEQLNRLPPTTVYQNASKMWQSWTNLARKNAVTQMATVMRNASTQSATGIISMFEDALAGTMEFGVDKFLGRTKGLKYGDYLANAYGDWMGTIGAMARGANKMAELLKLPKHKWGKWFDEYEKMVKSIEELPSEMARMYQTGIGGDLSSSALGNSIIRSTMKEFKSAKGLWDNLDKAADFLLLPNRAAEIEFRRMLYSGRLYGNLKRLGINNTDDFMAKLRSGEKLDDNLQRALTDATDHALKNTFAYSPEYGTLGKAVLNMYKDFPFLVGLGPYYPRFLINQYRYLMEHNPMQFMDALNPEFRKLLTKAIDDPLRSAEAYRTMARATTGATMLAGALAFTGMPGRENLKYYQVDTGEKDDKGNPVIGDIRAYQPFTSFAFMAELFRSVANGEYLPKNLTSAELTDAIAGVRNLQEVPIFAIADIIRTVDATDPMAFPQRISRIAGQMLAMPLVPYRMVQDIAGALGHEESAKQKDTRGDMLFGPAIANTPARSILPDLPDVNTGEPLTSEFPLQRQFFGLSKKTLHPLEGIMQNLGLRVGDLVGSYKNPEAALLTRKYIGKILGQQLNDKQTVGDMIAQTIQSLRMPDGSPAPDSLKLTVIRELFSEFREMGKTMGMAEKPEAFFEDLIKSEDPFTKELIQTYGSNDNAKQRPQPNQ